MKSIFVPLVGAVGLWLSQSGRADIQPPTPLPVASPAAEGVSAERLEHVHRFMREVIDAGHYHGAVTLIARNGKIVDWRAYGHRDLHGKSAMGRDAIFRIYSMTKTIASVAVLMLMEEGRLGLDDPVARFLPEFAQMQVFAGGTADAPQLRTAARPITIRHLLTHAAGFAVKGEDAAEALKIFDRANLQSAPDLKSYCERLSRLPLAADPGQHFNYDGTQLSVSSRIVEVVAGMPFEQFLRQRIFVPLRLEDTGFSVPERERGRIVEMSATDRTGRLIPSAEYTGKRAGDRIHPYPSGASGLYSTAADYLRFAQMLLNGGTLYGVCLLSRKTVELMMMNHLTHLVPPVEEYQAGEGFGLGGYVVVDVARRGRLGSPGQFGWLGAGSTYYTIDPKEQLIALLMMQHLPSDQPSDPPKISARFYNLVYQSLQ